MKLTNREEKFIRIKVYNNKLNLLLLHIKLFPKEQFKKQQKQI